VCAQKASRPATDRPVLEPRAVSSAGARRSQQAIFTTQQLQAGSGPRITHLPPTDWHPPSELPDLRRAGKIAIDTEELDRGLQADRGSAWPWRDGHICGVSVAWRADSIRSSYFPLRHPDSQNFDLATFTRWLKDHIAAGVRFTTLNGIYDWGWLGADLGVEMPPSDRLEEVGALAALVDENLFQYSLDALCKQYGLSGKDETLLIQAIDAAGLARGRKKINAREYIWQLPARFVGPYAETDAVRTLELYELFTPIIDREGTHDAYRLEVDLVPVAIEMRRRGIRVDQDATEQKRGLLLGKRDAALAELSKELGTAVSMAEINRSKWKAQTFDAHRIAYPRTAKGNPSFSAGKSGWMAKHEHWLPRGIAAASKYDAAGFKFLEGHILNHIVGGRIHAEIHPFRADDGGTRSSRFSYSNPPLQQMPVRDPELGPLIRGVFLPDEGEFWAKPDISQQEFRFVVHHAARHSLPGAREAAEVYRTNPDADFHTMVAEMTGLDRDMAKAVNFAKIYGAGVKKMAEMIGKPVAETQAIVSQYDSKLPFVSKLSHICQEKAVRIGATRLYDGALRHWNFWEVPRVFAEGAGPCGIEAARRRIADPDHPWYGQRLSRANTYTALNAQIQGDAARHTKLWMRACWREGIVPLLQMHDALEASVSTREQGEMIARLGCEAVSLQVPMRTDLKFGRSWGDASHTWEELIGESTPTKPAPTTPLNGVKTTTVVPTKPAIAIPPRPAIVIPPRPAISIPLPPRAPAASFSPPPQPALPPTDEMEIDLADLIDEPVPRDRMILCPFHGETKPSLRIYLDHYYCFGCGAYGDHVDWLMQVEGLEYGQARDIVDNWDGPVVPLSQPQETEGDAERTARALKWWNAAQPLPGTLAARYLRKVRGIDLDGLPDGIDEVLRFHPRCVFGPGTRHPCLLVLMRNPSSDSPTGIQRIGLTLDAQKIDRMMYGRCGVVKLWPAGKQLVIGEGLETTLAAATRLNYRDAPLRPAWAALSDGALSRFPVIDGVERLIVLADNDFNNAGQAAARACKQRWQQAGRSGVLLMPERPGADFNDIILKSRGYAS
jgi:DNA polymerase I-like protein with 3'-5' exonuclease and polymerase domains